MNLIIHYRLGILIAIAVTQVLSPVFFVPGGEGVGGSVYRALLVALTAFAALSVGMRDVTSSTRRALLVGAVLFAWMLLSLAWSKSFVTGLRQLSYVGTTLLLIYVLEIIMRGRREFWFFASATVLLGFGIALFAIYELQTGNHIHSKILEVDDYNSSLLYMTQNMAWFTFGNPNDLAVHLAFCSFVAIACISGMNLKSLGAIGLVAVSVYLMGALQARLALLALLVFSVVYCGSVLQRRASTGVLIAICATVFVALSVLFGLTLKESASFIDTSSFIRLQLLSSAIQASVDSYFVGVGVGGFEAHLASTGLEGRTYGILNPHNAFGRLLAENGLIGLALFVYMIVGPMAGILRAGRTTRLTAFVGSTTVATPILLSVGSDPMSSSTLGLAIAILWVGSRMPSSLEEQESMRAQARAQKRTHYLR